MCGHVVEQTDKGIEYAKGEMYCRREWMFRIRKRTKVQAMPSIDRSFCNPVRVRLTRG